jgi:hypothetical protein
MGFLSKIKKIFKGRRLLCDTCAYDYPSACSNPDRPNATSCKDYKKRY